MTSAVINSSSQLKTSADSQIEKGINIHFGGNQRRHSFLPDTWADSRETITNKNTIIHHAGSNEEEDDIFLLMHKSQDNKEKPLEKFCTGSKYVGQWNRLGIAGKGMYKYPHGVLYDGHFNKNGEFHGTGILVYPNGQRIEGIWKNGKLGSNCNYIAKAGVQMSDKYCIMPDRRFEIEFEEDFNPAGQEYLTDEHPPARTIPEGCYDIVSGFYDPAIKSVCEYSKEYVQSQNDLVKKSSTKLLVEGNDAKRDVYNQLIQITESDASLRELIETQGYISNKIISWIPSREQEEWIIKHCRKAWEDHLGYRPDMYEQWTKGGNIYSNSLDDGELDEDSMSHVKALNLDNPISSNSPSTRLMSFVKTAKQGSTTANLLSQMFKHRNVAADLDSSNS